MNTMKKGLVVSSAIAAVIAVLVVLVLLAATPATSYTPTTRYYTITAEQKSIEYAPGQFFTAWTYNGTIPGPVIRANVGDTIKVTLVNKDTIAHSFSPHGLDYNAADDGTMLYPGSIVQPGKSYTYTYTATRPGVYVYHCHSNDKYPLSVHVQQGLTGVVIIDDPLNPLPTTYNNLPVKEYVVIFDEIYGRLAETIAHGCSYCAGNAKYFALNMRQYPLPWAYNVTGGATNGVIENATAKTGQMVRFYVANLGNDIHSAHLHGNAFYKRSAASWSTTQLIDGDNYDLLPGDSAVLETIPKSPGNWLFHCHMEVHAEEGMLGVFNVTP